MEYVRLILGDRDGGFPDEDSGHYINVLHCRPGQRCEFPEQLATHKHLSEPGLRTPEGTDVIQGAMAGHAYKAAVDDLDGGVSRELDAPFRATVLEPVGKLNSYYGNINSAIDKRNHKVRWCFSFRAKQPHSYLAFAFCWDSW